MDDGREGCFPESYVLCADAVPADESVMQTQADEANVATVQAMLVTTLSVLFISCVQFC